MFNIQSFYSKNLKYVDPGYEKLPKWNVIIKNGTQIKLSLRVLGGVKQSEHKNSSSLF